MARKLVYLFLVLATVFPVSSHALIVDFETTPSLAQGPSTFAEAGAAQTISVSGITFTGGVVLGFPTAFNASIYSTTPNVYGTSSFGDSSLSPNLHISIPVMFDATSVEGLLFNGLNSTQAYRVEAYSVALLIQTLNFSIPANTLSGYEIFSFSGNMITSIVFTPESTSYFDYVIDTIAFNQPIEDVNPIPEPSTLFLLGSGLVGLVGYGRRRLKK